MSVMTEHERNYMPSEWSRRYSDSTELLVDYFKFCDKVTKEVRKTIKNELNISYSTGEKTKYDLYGTDLPNDAPIFVFIHGGYWQEFSKDAAGFVVNSLVSRGIKVVVAGYDLCPQVTLTEIVAEIKVLVENILTLAHKSKAKSVWVAGHSAGAHLAASLLYDQAWLNKMERLNIASYLKGIILIGGIFDLKPLLTTSINNPLKLTATEVEQFSLSPIDKAHMRDDQNQIKGVKVLVTVGDCDSPIFIEESRRMTKRLVSFVDNVEFLLLRNIDHFDIVENLTNNDFILTEKILHNIL